MSGMSGKNVPALRFPGYEEAWSWATLGQHFSFKNGVNAEKSAYGHGSKYISVLDITSDRPIIHDSILGSVTISSIELKNYEVRFGDILFQRSSETREEVGQSNVYLDPDHSAVFGGFVIRGRAIKKHDPVFFHYLLKTASIRKDMTSRSGGSTRYNVGQESLSAVSIAIPAVTAEQEKIAAFLGAADAKTAGLEKKKVLLADYKRGVMQKLFSHDLRFKDDQGRDFPDWEEEYLGNLGDFYGGGTPDTANRAYWEGTIPWVSSSDVVEDSISNVRLTRYVSSKAINESATKVVPKGSILIVSRVGVGKLAVAPVDLCTSQDFCNFFPAKGSPAFLAYSLSNSRKALLTLCQGTSIQGLTTKELRRMRVSLPCPDEQDKIASFLSAIDTKISHVTAEIATAKTFKKGLLQQMFV